MSIPLNLLFLIGVVIESHAQTPSILSATYSNQSYWYVNWPVCGSNMQSPIDLQPNNATFFNWSSNPLVFTNYNTTFNTTEYDFTNNGQTIMINVSTSAMSNNIVISGGGLPTNYTLFQFHFHWGSDNSMGAEHSINGMFYPMEIHVIHYDANKYPNNYIAATNNTNGIAALSIHVEIDPNNQNNPFFAEVINYFQNITHQYDSVDDITPFQMASILPSNTMDYYRYPGSYSVPPCYQSIIWTIFNQPIYISQAQMNYFRGILYENDGQLMDNNHRYPQPLNNRTVYKTFNSSAILPTPFTPPTPPMTTTPMNTATMTATPMNTATMPATPMNTATMTATPMNTATMTTTAATNSTAASQTTPASTAGGQERCIFYPVLCLILLLQKRF